MHKELTLNNGLRVILAPVAGVKSCTILKGYHVGSRHEKGEMEGASHFVEHMMFKGTEKRPRVRDIAIELDRIGAQYNAYTDKDITAYYVKTSSRHIEKAMEILSDMTYNAVFPPEEFEKEKGVITEEISMYEDMPVHYVGDIYEQMAYTGTPLAHDILGTRQTIADMSREKLLGYKERFYGDNNSTLILAGHIPDDIENMLNAYFSHDASDSEKPEDENIQIPSQGADIVIHKKDVEQVHMQLGYLCHGYAHEDREVYSVISSLMGGGMSSPLFDEVRVKRGLCYYIRMAPDVFQDIGSLTIQAGLNKEKLHEALDAVMDIIRSFKEGEFSEEDIENAKEYIIGNTLLHLEDTADLAESYLKRYTVLGELLTPEQRIERVKKVTKDDIMRVMNEVFVNERARMAVIIDDADEKTLLSKIKL